MWFLLLIAIILIIYLFSRRPKPKDINSQLEARNRDWAQFIVGFRSSAKNKSENDLIDKMLTEIARNGLPLPPGVTFDNTIENVQTAAVNVSNKYVSGTDPIQQPNQSPPKLAVQKNKSQIQLDNASLLLYFGAFLFVASTGLFVVFGGVSGGIRCLIVLIVTAVMYMTGVSLYHSKPKFAQAGLAFAGIGMAIAPLIGLAAYNYLFNHSHGQQIWLFTSVLTLIMYAHALVVLRKPLINYLFIATFLSLFESGVSIINSPIYYFGWMLAFIGIVLSIFSRLSGFWPELKQSSSNSGAVFLPLALFTSLVLIPTHGSAQFGVSILLGAIYYLLETISSKGSKKLINAVVAQSCLILATTSLGYAYNNSWSFVGEMLLILSIVEATVVLITPSSDVLWHNFASVAIVSEFIAIFLGVQKPGVVLASTAALVITSVAIWIRQKRVDAYAVGAISLLALPIVYGQFFLTHHLSSLNQTELIALSLVLQLVVLFMKKTFNDEQRIISKEVYIFSSIVLLIASLLTGQWTSVVVSVSLTFTALLLGEMYQDQDWIIVAGLMISAPLIRGISGEGAFLTTTLMALGANITLSLKYRVEANRWFSTILWLVLPVAIGSGIIGYKFGLVAYSWSYLVITLIFVLSRSIARGVLLVSSKVPLASYAKTASYSYVFGYIISIVGATVLSLLIANGRINTSIVLALVGLIIWYISDKVEKIPTLYLLLPVIAQAVLLSVFRPAGGSSLLYAYLLLSSGLAVVSYLVLNEKNTSSTDKLNYIQIGALASAFISPSAVLFTGQASIWPMPFGLLIGAVLVYYHIRNTSQEYRELVGGLMLISLFWFMFIIGVRNFQAYSHVLALFFAGYAYWRHLRSETTQSSNYLYAMLATATVPLAIQAISGQAGGLYGWWLLIEQIVFMVIGMTINKKFVTMWGLYVAIGAVLYQLRNLGWAALTVLALFIIGMAIYKIQKYNESPKL